MVFLGGFQGWVFREEIRDVSGQGCDWRMKVGCGYAYVVKERKKRVYINTVALLGEREVKFCLNDCR